MIEITCRKVTCNDRVLEKALEVADDIYWGNHREGDKELLDMLIDFLDPEGVENADWDFLCMVNGGETADYWDSYGAGEAERVYQRVRDLA